VYVRSRNIWCDSVHVSNSNKRNNMRVRFLKQGKLFIVERINSKQIIFSNKSKSECYEYIFKTINYV
jgi:hypothetical protein